MHIQVWHGMQSGPVLSHFNQIVQEWNAAHQDEYEIQLTHSADKYSDPANKALAISPEERPDLVLAPESMTSTMMQALKRKELIPIKDILDQTLLSQIAKIVKLTFGDESGELASLPFNPACGVLYTNKDLLKACGYAPDYIPVSLEELEIISKKLIDMGLTKGGYTCAWPAAYLVEIPAAQNNLPLVEPANGKLGFGTYQLSQKSLTNHLLDVKQQQKNKVFIYGGRTNDARTLFTERRVAFFMQGSSHYELLEKEIKATSIPFQMGCGPLPTLVRGQTDKYAFPLGGTSIWVFNKPNIEKILAGVKDFLNYLASKEVQEKWHKQTAYVPILASLPSQLETFYKDHPLHRAVIAQTLEAKLGEYSFGIHMPDYQKTRLEIFQLIEDILDEKNSDEQAIELLKDFDSGFSIKPS